MNANLNRKHTVIGARRAQSLRIQFGRNNNFMFMGEFFQRLKLVHETLGFVAHSLVFHAFRFHIMTFLEKIIQKLDHLNNYVYVR